MRIKKKNLPQFYAKRSNKNKRMELEHDHKERAELVKNLDEEVPKHACVGSQVGEEHAISYIFC